MTETKDQQIARVEHLDTAASKLWKERDSLREQLRQAKQPCQRCEELTAYLRGYRELLKMNLELDESRKLREELERKCGLDQEPAPGEEGE